MSKPDLPGPPRCRYCYRRIYATSAETKHGHGWIHTESNTEVCPPSRRQRRAAGSGGRLTVAKPQLVAGHRVRVS